MKRLLPPLLLSFTVVAVMAAASTAYAQVEVLQPQQVEGYAKQLPTVTQSVSQKALQRYLSTLKPASPPTMIANAVRVANDAKNSSLPADAFLGYYAVPAMSPNLRLPDAYPTDGVFSGTVEAVIAQDQYEDASFAVYPFADIDGADLKLSPLKSADGSVFPAEDLDLRVVKVWYQNGNGWYSYFADPGLKLVPELLLHDENLIRVDTKNPANYARINMAKGAKEVWISAPRKANVGFDPYQDGFADAKTLQPVALRAGEFKQFVVTAHAKPDTKPGLYRGNITVAAKGQKSITIPVAIKVLSFQLPLPKTNYDDKKDFVVSLMGAWPKLDPDSKAMLPTLKNLRAHNILQTGPDVKYPFTSKEEAVLQVKLMKDAVFLTKPIFVGNMPPSASSGFGERPILYDDQMAYERAAKWYSDFYQKNFGHTDAFMNDGDEPGAEWLMNERANWRITHRYGLKTYIAGWISPNFPTSGYILDGRPTAANPAQSDKTKLWNQMGEGYTGLYAGQHNASENPAFVRRQHGLLGYLSNFDMVDNYEFAYGPWNDRPSDLYRPMVLAYPISDGLVDTLEWEGFRAGIDDIRYATKLRQLADDAIASGSIDRVDAGKKVRQWFAEMDGSNVNLNTVRIEMITKINDLLKGGPNK